MVGDGCMMFQPVPDSKYSITALSSLVEGMVKEEMVAVVRRVYAKNNNPVLAALIPEDTFNAGGEEVRSLVYIALPFAEDLRNYQFPPLWSSKEDGSCTDGNPSQEQLKAVDKLIDSMLDTPKDDAHLDAV